MWGTGGGARHQQPIICCHQLNLPYLNISHLYLAVLCFFVFGLNLSDFKTHLLSRTSIMEYLQQFIGFRGFPGFSVINRSFSFSFNPGSIQSPFFLPFWYFSYIWSGSWSGSRPGSSSNVAYRSCHPNIDSAPIQASSASGCPSGSIVLEGLAHE